MMQSQQVQNCIKSINVTWLLITVWHFIVVVDVSGFGLSKISDFMPEDAQTISKGCIRAKSGTVIEDSGVREEIDRALIRQFDLLPVARKMVMEELANGQQN